VDKPPVCIDFDENPLSSEFAASIMLEKTVLTTVLVMLFLLAARTQVPPVILGQQVLFLLLSFFLCFLDGKYST